MQCASIVVITEISIARFRVHERYLKGNMGDETPLELLIPTTEGGGICTTALVWFLVFKHNEFIERCRIIIKERDKRYFVGYHAVLINLVKLQHITQ